MPGKHSFLLKRVDDTGPDGVLEQLGRPRREHEQDARLGQAAREEMERLPGRAIRQVNVVKDDDQAGPQAQGGEQAGERGEHANAGRPARSAMTRRGADRRKDLGEVVCGLAGQRGDVRAVERAQVPFECLDPQAERRRRAQRVRPRGQRDDVVATGRDLSSEPRLPHAGIAEQQHDPQLALLGHVEGLVEEENVRISPD
jgi:hypothetical protein